MTTKRIYAAMEKLPESRRKISQLEKRIAELERRLGDSSGEDS